jgi:preprotein translocase subunit YajC
MLASLFLLSGGQEGQPGSMWGMMLPLILIFAIMYLLILRPQAKRQKEHQKMLTSLEKGDRIMTAGGIYGTIVGVKEKDNILIVKVADNVKLEVARTSVARKLGETDKEGS